MTLQALREKIGDATFFRIMRDWAHAEPLRQRDDGAVHRARRADVSGMDLEHFFDVWLYQPDKPTSW